MQRPQPPTGGIRVEGDALSRFVRDLFRACGVPEVSASIIADAVLTADLRGASSHGCALVPGYLERMLDGRIDPAGTPEVIKDAGAALVVDGRNSLGQVGLAFAMGHAIDRAGETGVCAVAVGGSNHCGAMGYFAMLALPHDMIGIATTNGLPTMAWWGGLDRILSINPIGVAIPSGVEAPIVIDMSFGGAARGKIALHQQEHRPLPEGWATDADGTPTIDPVSALAGLIQPAGGYKGTSMALVMGILSSLLSGAAYGTELGDFQRGPTPGRDGHFGLVINIAAFEDVARFKARVDKVIAEIHASRRAPGVDRVLLPGEQAAETERACQKKGVPLTEGTWQALSAVAGRLSVTTPETRQG